MARSLRWFVIFLLGASLIVVSAYAQTCSGDNPGADCEGTSGDDTISVDSDATDTVVQPGEGNDTVEGNGNEIDNTNINAPVVADEADGVTVNDLDATSSNVDVIRGENGDMTVNDSTVTGSNGAGVSQGPTYEGCPDACTPTDGDTGSVTVNNTTVTVTDNGRGVAESGGGDVTVNDSTIDVSGDDFVVGVAEDEDDRAENNSGDVTVNNTDITVTGGDEATGVNEQAAGNVTVDGASNITVTTDNGSATVIRYN